MTILLTRTIDSDTVPTYYISDDGRIIAQLTADQMATIAADYERMQDDDHAKAEAARTAAEAAKSRAEELAARRTVTINGEDWIIQKHWGYRMDHDICAWPAQYADKALAPLAVQMAGFGDARPWVIETHRNKTYPHLRDQLAGANGNPRRFSTIEAAIKAVQTHVALTAADQKGAGHG